MGGTAALCKYKQGQYKYHKGDEEAVVASGLPFERGHEAPGGLHCGVTRAVLLLRRAKCGSALAVPGRDWSRPKAPPVSANESLPALVTEYRGLWLHS